MLAEEANGARAQHARLHHLCRVRVRVAVAQRRVAVALDALLLHERRGRRRGRRRGGRPQPKHGVAPLHVVHKQRDGEREHDCGLECECECECEWKCDIGWLLCGSFLVTAADLLLVVLDAHETHSACECACARPA